jgi:hypothetical protein
MVNLKIREKLPPDAIVFDNASYDNSIIGSTFDGRAIYDFNVMVKEYAEDNECDELEAIEWIEYNTMRALPYAGEKAPEVVNWVCE